MIASRTSWGPEGEERLEHLIGTLLRAGVVCAAAVALLGGVVFLARHGSEPASYNVFHGEPQDLRTVPGVVREALTLRGRGLAQLGLLLLIATPVARVVFTLVAFARAGDRRYVVVTGIVLAALLFSLVGRQP
jgi:uncharacterized membrane protein